MRGLTKILWERDPDSVIPFGYNLIVEYSETEWKSVIAKPQQKEKDMKPREGFLAKVYTVGEKVSKEGIVPGAIVAVDETIDPYGGHRAFMWGGKHYVIVDQYSVIASDRPQFVMGPSQQIC